MPDDNPFICLPLVIRQIVVPEKEQRTEVYLFEVEDGNVESTQDGA